MCEAFFGMSSSGSSFFAVDEAAHVAWVGLNMPLTLEVRRRVDLLTGMAHRFFPFW